MALCTDTYDEINGVATISREFAAYAERRPSPLLILRPGPALGVSRRGSVTFVDVPKSRASLPLDMGCGSICWRGATGGGCGDGSRSSIPKCCT